MACRNSFSVKIIVRSTVGPPVTAVLHRDPNAPPQGYYVVGHGTQPSPRTPQQLAPATVYRRSLDQPHYVVNNHHS